MNDKHTLGPWKVLQWADERKGFIAIVTDEQRHVADVFPFGKRVEGTELAEHIANARIIAAAPEMYAAILTTACPAGGWNGMPKELEGICTVADCVKYGTCGCDLGAAIARATGSETREG